MRLIRYAVAVRTLFLAALCLLPPLEALAADATLFRLFLIDGSAMVSYGEYARIDDRVIFSMPVGGPADDPRLHVVMIPAGVVDWERTERYALSARYQHYVATRGEEDFDRLSNDVANVLNQIAVSTDPRRALAVAEEARRVLATWPQAHYGYRQDDVREIVGLVDDAISSLRASVGGNSFELSFVAVAAPAPPPLEPVLGMPTPREQLVQILRVVAMTSRSSERVALLRGALALIAEEDTRIGAADATSWKRVAEAQIRYEVKTDERYGSLATRLMAQANRAAARARVSDVERALGELPKEDARLGRQRPELVQALNVSLQERLEAARRLRLLLDQWEVRQSLYRDYQRLVGAQLTQLTRAQPVLDAIRRLEGPSLDALRELSSRLSGGAAHLERLHAPPDVRATHELLVGAWRFAESATQGRERAIASGDLGTAWEASSAAAGAIMMFSRAQEQLREMLDPPKLQ